MIYGGGNPETFGYANADRPTSQYGSSSEHIIKYGASYYIDGGDRGTENFLVMLQIQVKKYLVIEE